jgi:hypothetical protein
MFVDAECRPATLILDVDRSWTSDDELPAIRAPFENLAGNLDLQRKCGPDRQAIGFVEYRHLVDERHNRAV